MKLFRYILFVGLMIVGVGVKGQIPNNKLCSSGILTSGSFIFCSGDSIKLYVNNDTANTKYFFQWMKGSYPVLTPIAGAVNASLFVKTGGDFYIRIIDTLAKDTCFRVQNVTMNPKPNANFTFTPNTGCGRTEVQFTNALQTITNLQYMWNMGDPSSGGSNNPNTANPQHIYIPSASGAAQTYTISLTLKDANTNCSSSSSQTITIGAGPDAKLDESGTINYEGKVTFKDCSGGNNFTFTFNNNSSTNSALISNYKIVWGDLSSDFSVSSFTSTTHTYPIGLYSLKYIITGNNGCTNTKEYLVFVGTNPAVGISSLGNTDICTGSLLSFAIDTARTNKNPPGTTYTIHYSDGSTDTSFSTYPAPNQVSHLFNTSSCGKTGLFNAPDEFFAQITAVNPCKSTSGAVGGIVVSLKPEVKFNSNLPTDTTCINSTVIYTSNSNIGTIPYSGSNCNSGNIVWDIQPSTGWTLTTGTLGNGTNSNPNSWTSGSSNISINFSVAGTYTIKLKGSGFNTKCGYDSLVKTICVNPTPTASFTVPKDTLCAGENLSFTSTSNTPLCGSNIYSWSVVPSGISGCSAAAAPTFVSGTSASSANPVMNFSKPGTYVVGLTTTILGTNCTSVAFTKTITVKDKPTVSVSLSRPTICQGDTVTPIVAPTCFSNNATYNWAFTNGTPATSNLKNPGGITFNTSGSNNISVTVTNTCGNATQATSVNVVPSPTLTAIASNATICNGQNATINLVSNQVGIKYTWTSTVTSGAASGNSNQSTPITTTTINNTLNNTGSVDAVVRYTITVIGATGCVGETKTVDITVRPGTTPPNAGADQSLCNATTTTLAGNNPTVGTGTWTQILGGAATITNANLYNTTITGLVPDVYQFVWTITGSGGGSCPNTPDTMKITNRPTITTANAGTDIIVCNYSSGNNSVTLQGNAATPSRAYETGTWTVVTNPSGSTTNFSNDHSPTATFTFNKTGIYTLVWTITNDINCPPTSDTVIIKVYQAAVGGTTNSNATVCKNNNAGTITLTGFTGNIVKWQYKVSGSSNWVDIANTTATLSYTNLDTTTIYQAIISTTNTTDCPITATSLPTTITVNPVPVISNLQGNSPTQCASNTGSISFTVTPASGNYAITYTLNGGNQTANINTTNGTITINNLAAGLYDNIKVTLNGCTSNTLGSITLSNPNKPATPVITANTPICSGGTLNLSATTSSLGAATYNWVFKDGSTPSGATQSISNITVAQSGIYHVTVTINQCTSNDTTINIVVNQTPAALATTTVTYCQNAIATALSPSGSNYVWYNNAGLNNGSTTAPIPSTTTVGNTTYYVIDSNITTGCKSGSSSLVVTVNATPVISNLTRINPQQCQATNGSISFNVTPVTGSYTIDYTKGGVAQTSITGVNPFAGVITIPNLSAGLYDNIKVTLNGCLSNTLGSITLSDPTKPVTPIVTGNTPICSGGTLSLGISNSYTGTVSYNWTGPNGFSNNSSASPAINNIQTNGTGTYSVTVTIAGCVSDAGTVAIVVNQTPAAPATTAVTYCQNAIATALSPNASNYVWYNNAGLNNGSTTAPTPTTTTVGNTTYYVIDSNVTTGCKSGSSSLVVTVNATPVISNLTKINPQQCQASNGSISFNVTPTAGSYTIDYTKGGVAQTSITGVNPVAGIITIPNLSAELYDNIKVTLNGCPSNTLGSITLNDPTKPATPVIVGADSICTGKNLILNTATTIAGGTYKWTDPLNVSTTANSLIVNNITTNYTGVFRVSVNVNLCKSNDTTFTVRVDSTPVTPSLLANPVCTDSTVKLFATTVYPMTITYSWSGVNGFSSSVQNPTISSATLAMAGNYDAYVTSTTGKCQSQTSTVNLVVNETPHISFKDSTNPSQCATPTGNIRLSGLVANTIYSITYTVNGNTVSQSQKSDGGGVVKIDTLRAGTYSNIFVTLNACPSNLIGSYTLVDPNPPATPVIISVDSICSGKSLTLSAASPIAGAIYTWTHPVGTTTTGTSYTVSNSSMNDNGTYRLYVTLNLCKSKDTSFNVRVDSTPVAPVLSSNSPVCTDSTIKLFANTVYPMAITYSWSGVNSFTSTQQNPIITNATLAMAGNYNAYVTGVVGACQSPSSTIPVAVNETPNVAQLQDTTYKDGANSGNISFSGTVTNTIFNWTNSNPAIGLAASGTGTINFNATNTSPFVISGLITVTPSTSFCSGKPMIFTIYVNPTPTLTSPLKDTICTDISYNYQAASSTPNVKYSWTRKAVAGISNAAAASTDSTGVINETLFNTTTLPVDVTYEFKLYSLGSVNTVPFVLTVNPNAKAFYTFANDKLCTPAIIDTNNIKTVIYPITNSSYVWYNNGSLLGTGTNFPGYTISNNGDTVYIKLKALSAFGCKADSFEHKFYTVKTPTVSFIKSIAKGCGPLSVDFTNTSTPLNAPNYLWDFGNGQTSTQQSPTNISFIADTSYNRHDTTYYITLTAITQCDTIRYKDSVTVLPKPRALFQPDTTVGCSVFHFAAFNNSLGTGNTYTWDFGDSTALVIDTAYGYYYHNFKVLNTDTFNVKLKAENVCGVDSFTVNVVVFPNTIVPKLVVDGTNNFGCAPTNIRFINNTRGANKFTVNFGDGSLPYISTNNPDTIYHYYISGGNYIATLKAQNSCTDSTVKLVIQLYDKPVAGFTTSKVDYCKNDNISFVNTSDTTLSMQWNFGDGITSTAIHPKHIYAAIGTYTITQIVQSTNASGAVCTDTARKTIVVHEVPTAVFTTNAALQNCQPYFFEGVAPIVIGYNYNWKFYDNYSIDTVKAGAVGDHIFYKTGIFNVRLIVFNKYGCSDTGYTSVKVIETPKAMFVATDSIVCVPGKSISFTNTTTYSAGDAVNYEWYVNGVKQTTTTNFVYNFSANPNITTAVVFNIKLIATNTFGCKDSIVKKVVIQPKAIASFQINAAQGCAPFSLQLNNSSQYANIFKWFVDGNLFSVAASPTSVTLPTPDKNYIIKLVADHNLGCGADSTVLQFTTYPKPVADFYIPTTTSCNGILKINCFDISKVTGGIIKQWNWSFGDSKTDTTQNPAHTYTIAGAYSVSLWVKDDKNCISDVAHKTVKNFGKPKADFAVGSVCLGSNTIPVNLSTVGFGSNAITSYLWNFGDGTLLTGLQPVHQYIQEGTYNISLIVTADSSCVADTTTKQVIVYGKPTANFSFNNTCVNQATQFNNTSLFGYGQTNIGNSLWNFGDGVTSNTNNTQHSYLNTGNYNVKLQVSGNRCPNLTDTISKTITISKPRDAVVYPRIETAKGTSVQLNAMNGGVNYQWLPANYLDNAFIQNPLASFVLTSPNIINYQIKITDSVGCVATDKQEIWLFATADIFLPTAFTPNGDNANDVFKPLYVSIQKIQYFRVFDRWGKIVFETSDMGKGWDGTFNSKQLPTDTYVWTIAGFSNDGKEILRKGNVTLIRE